MTNISISDSLKKFSASFIVDIIGFPLMLKLVFNTKGQLVNLKNSLIFKVIVFHVGLVEM